MKTSPSRNRFLSRRHFAVNTGLLALLGPVFRRMDALAASAPAPRRIILLFSPNGPMNAAGTASGNETDFAIHDWWKPLERHKSDGIFFSHTACTGAGVVKGGGHGLGGQTFSGFGGFANDDQYADNGPTIDQVIAKRLQSEQRAGVAPSLVWGTVSASQGGGTGDAFCAAPGRNITPETSPSKAWAQLFANFTSPTQDPAQVKRAAALIARNQSILDFAIRDCASLQSALGKEGTRLLDDHCTTVRAMEKALVNGPSAVANACTKPADPGSKDWPNPENVEVQSSAFFDLLSFTFACELSHVVGFQFGAQAARNRIATKYGVPSSPTADSGDSGPAHHPWTHQDNSDTKTHALQIFTTYYATQVALLLDRLKSTQDASGKPLLDSTVVLWLSELGGNPKNSDAHQTGSVPAVLFGGGQGTFKTGRYLRGKSPEVGTDGSGYVEAGRDMARVLVSLIQYMGLTDVSTVGVTGVNEPLAALLG